MFPVQKWFHNQCLKSPLSMGIYGHMIESPDNVRVFCPKCVDVIEGFKDDILTVSSMLKKCQSNIIGCVQSLSDNLKSAIQCIKSDLPEPESQNTILRCIKSLSENVMAAVEEKNVWGSTPQGVDELKRAVETTCRAVVELGETANTNTGSYENALNTVMEKAR